MVGHVAIQSQARWRVVLRYSPPPSPPAAPIPSCVPSAARRVVWPLNSELRVEGRILRGQLEVASLKIDLRQLDSGGLGLEFGSESGLGFRRK